MNRKTSLLLGGGLLIVGALLLVSILARVPSGWWSPNGWAVHWTKISGMEMVNGNLQFKLDPPQTGGGPTSAELTELVLQADPTFFEGAPFNQNIHINTYEKFYPISGGLIEKYGPGLVGLLVFQVTNSPSTRVYGYMGAGLSLLIGLVFLLRKPRNQPAARPAGMLAPVA